MSTGTSYESAMTDPKRCLITGANSGIGKQAAVQLAAKGFGVIMGCRSLERGKAALAEVRRQSGNDGAELVQMDLSSPASIRAAAEGLVEGGAALDVVIHNAASFDITRKQRVLTDDGVELTWATNHLGPVLLTDLLLPALRRAEQGRLILISSKGLIAHPRLRVDLEDPEFEDRKFGVQKAYYQSKLAQVCYLFELAEQLADTAITVHGVRVTNVKIDTSRYPDMPKALLWIYSMKSAFSISPAEMAETYTWLAAGDAAGQVTGRYWDSIDRSAKPPKAALDVEHRRQVMARTRQYLDRFAAS